MAYLSYFTIFHSSNFKIFQPHFAQHIISQLMQIEGSSLSSWSSFHIFLSNRCTPKPQLLLVTSFISCNMKTNGVLILSILKF